jgi:hypothetical protein
VTGNVVAACVGTSVGTTVGLLIVHRRTWRCWLFGHVATPIPTWRWSHRAVNMFGERGAAVPLSACARRRARRAARICRRCHSRYL